MESVNNENLTSNLTKALAGGESNENSYADVEVFLESISLDKYIDAFIDNGIEDLDTILELNDTHLETMKIPMGHKLKI